jgi:hypothetical protein
VIAGPGLLTTGRSDESQRAPCSPASPFFIEHAPQPQLRDLLAQTAASHVRQTIASCSPPTMASNMARPDTPRTTEATEASLRLAGCRIRSGAPDLLPMLITSGLLVIRHKCKNLGKPTLRLADLSAKQFGADLAKTLTLAEGVQYMAIDMDKLNAFSGRFVRRVYCSFSTLLCTPCSRSE